jgi:hypothetical protein
MNHFANFLPSDIDECSENPQICGGAQCRNSYGTYDCIEETTTTTTQPSTTHPTTTESTSTEFTTTESTTTEANDDFTHEDRKNDKDENIAMGNHENSSFEGDTNEESLSGEEEEENDADNMESSTIRHTVQENVFPNELSESSTTNANNENFDRTKEHSEVETDGEDVESEREHEEEEGDEDDKNDSEHHRTSTEKAFDTISRHGELFVDASQISQNGNSIFPVEICEEHEKECHQIKCCHFPFRNTPGKRISEHCSRVSRR